MHKTYVYTLICATCADTHFYAHFHARLDELVSNVGHEGEEVIVQQHANLPCRYVWMDGWMDECVCVCVFVSAYAFIH